MSHRLQTIYALEDSPVGLAAWLIDHDTRSYALIARVFDGQTEGLTRDDVLDNITLYWLTNTAVSSARIYWENNKYTFFAPKHVAIPVAVSAFPDEVVQTPRSWTERAYPNLIYYNKHRGRDRPCGRPPAQIPASGITALGSCYEYLAANRFSGNGCLITAVGSQRSTMRSIRSQVTRVFWLRRPSGVPPVPDDLVPEGSHRLRSCRARRNSLMCP